MFCQPVACLSARVAARYSVNRQHTQSLILICLPDDVIQCGFRPGFLIDLFDYNVTNQGMSAVGGWQASGYDNGACGHTPVSNFATFPIVDLRAQAYKNTHRYDGTLLNDDAFDNF